MITWLIEGEEGPLHRETFIMPLAITRCDEINMVKSLFYFQFRWDKLHI